ncbi:MAG TPA: SDR family NAD(P)-dependent oxidoreductase [Anaeromyxobacteraceae bacterium]|nr:SDR family NAD(P)-dependent oxidoreductase [Anaeromyxobacteraceae bacterium]
MIFPFESLSDERRALGIGVAAVVGVAFGFVQERTGFGRAQKLVAQFYGHDMTVFKAMFTAIVTAMLGTVLLAGLGLLDLRAVEVGYPTFLWPMIVGGLVLGAGFIVSGYCPGTSFVAAASGKLDGLVTVLGVVLGTLVYAETEPALGGFQDSGRLGGFFLYQWLGLPRPLVAVLIAVLAIVGFVVATRIERRFRTQAALPGGEGAAAGGARRRGAVLVTGASSGIGADLARAFARRGRNLVLVARSRERLDELARELVAVHRVGVRVVVSDLASPGAVAALHAALSADGVEVETLVNDAGFGLRGAFVELDARRQGDMVQVNVAALTELCRVFAEDLVRRGGGAILNVAGLAGVMPGPGMAVYCATKAYVLSFTEALANELRSAGILVSCLSPGPTETRFADAAGFSALRLFRVSAPMSPAAVAEAGLAALEQGTSLEVPGWRNRLLAASVRLVPARTAAAMARHMLESPPSEARKLTTA